MKIFSPYSAEINKAIGENITAEFATDAAHAEIILRSFAAAGATGEIIDFYSIISGQANYRRRHNNRCGTKKTT